MFTCFRFDIYKRNTDVDVILSSRMPGLPLMRVPSPVVEPVDTEVSLQNSVEYFDTEEDGYQEWAANPNPAEEGFSYPDFVVRALVDERDQLRSENLELTDDVQEQLEEVQKLLKTIEDLQIQVKDLQDDRASVGRRLRHATAKIRYLEAHVRSKDANLARGMKRMRESYEAFELAMTEPVMEETHRSAASVNRRVRGASGSGYGADSEPSVAGPLAGPVAPTVEPGPYQGWVSRGNYE